MKTTDLNADFWNNRYLTQQMGWDIGYASPPLIDYALSQVAKDARILIPGTGNGYELEALWKQGYTHVYGADLSEKAKVNFLERVTDFPEAQYLLGDFFSLEGRYDVILEQTFFCAIEPSWRSDYVRKVHELLSPGGRLAGVLFNFEKPEGPPFGGSEEEYRQLFGGVLEVKTMEECYNSIEPRRGSEFFIEIVKKIKN